MVVATNWMAIGKQYVPGNAWFRMDKATIPTTNLVFVLALTPSGDNVIVSAKVLDKTSGVIVIHSSFVDTPSADPALTSAEVAQLTGCREWQDVRTDPAIAPWVNGTAPLLYVFQDAAGSMPPAQATFDNLAMRIYDVPRIGIQPVMRLTWLAPSGVNYAVEVAPTPQGPWQPLSLSVTDSGIPGMKQASVPANSTAQFFRLVQAP
jgi:hypothetical protein